MPCKLTSLLLTFQIYRLNRIRGSDLDQQMINESSSIYGGGPNAKLHNHCNKQLELVDNKDDVTAQITLQVCRHVNRRQEASVLQMGKIRGHVTKHNSYCCALYSH